MAQHVEPMDIDSSVCDFDNKENTSIHTNVLPRTPCTEKGYEELDVTELNMKLRYSLTPNMSKSYTACPDRNLESGDGINNENNLTRSYNGNDTVTKTLKPMPLQALPSELIGDGIRTAFRPLDATNTLDDACIITRNDDENVSIPSSSSSWTHTPEAITPTTEIPKSDGSPIMRGLKSVLNMFRPSQSPIPPDDFMPIPVEEEIKPETLSPPVIHSPETSNSKPQMVLASTPLAAYKTKDVLRRHGPNGDSVVFNEDLEKDLQWNDETTIIFSHEKIPLHKLLFQTKPDSVQKKNNFKKEMPQEDYNLDSTVEHMDISYNDSIGKDKTITKDDVLKKDYIASESDSEFLDCESTFTKNESFVDPNDLTSPYVIDNEVIQENDELNDTITKESLDIKAVVASLALENPKNQSENKLVSGSTPVKDENNSKGYENNFDNIALRAGEATILEDIDNGNVIEFKPEPQIDLNLNKTNILDTSEFVSSTSPALDNIVVSSLSQTPLISDPRILLFNISQTVENKDDNLNAADVLNNEEQIKHYGNAQIIDAVTVGEIENDILLRSEISDEKPNTDETNKLVEKENILEVPSAKELLDVDKTFDPMDISQFINEHQSVNETGNPEAKVSFVADKLNENNQSNHDETFAIVDEISALETELENKSNMSETANKSALEKYTSMSDQMSEDCKENSILKLNQNLEHEISNKSDSSVIPAIDTITAAAENSFHLVNSKEISADIKELDAPLPTPENYYENISQVHVNHTENKNTFTEILNEVQTIQVDKEKNVDNKLLVKSEVQFDSSQATFAEEISTIVKEDVKEGFSYAEDFLETHVEVMEPKVNAEIRSVLSENIDIESKPDCKREESSLESKPVNNKEERIIVSHGSDNVLEAVVSPTEKIFTNAEEILETNVEVLKPKVNAEIRSVLSENIDIKTKPDCIREQSSIESKPGKNKEELIIISHGSDILEAVVSRTEKKCENKNITSTVEEFRSEIPFSSVVVKELYAPNKFKETCTDVIENICPEQNKSQSSSEIKPVTVSVVKQKEDFIETMKAFEHEHDLKTKSKILEEISEIAAKDEEILSSESKIAEEISEMAVKDEEIVLSESNIPEEILSSEGNSPVVSVSAEINEIPAIQSSDIIEDIANTSVTKTASAPPASPPIASKGYNFNFDEIDDPFSTRTNIRLSPPPDTPPKKIFEGAKPTQQIQKKDLNKNRRRSQQERKKPLTNNKKMNSTFSGGFIQSHTTGMKDPKLTPLSDKTFENNEDKAVCEDNIESTVVIKNDTVNDIVKKVVDTSDEEKMSIDPGIFSAEKELNIVNYEEKMSVDVEFLNTENVASISKVEKNSVQLDSNYTIKEQVIPSLSEQSTYFSAGTSSTELGEPKNVFNLPEIDDMNFNRFATITKIKHSPGKDAINSSTLKEMENTTFGNNTTDDGSIQANSRVQTKVKEMIEDIEILNNISGDTCSSKEDEEKNNTVQEVHTEDEDTVEGPFIEAHLKDDKMIEFGASESDMMNFDLPTQTNDENADAGELFIDADAFEFLLNQNNDNTVADSGKESLFLKFDPLFAKRISSDGVVAALSKLQTRKSTPRKTIPENETVNQKSPVAGPSKVNVTQDIDTNSTEESIDELNITVSKPMMVVNPAVNAIVTPRKTKSSLNSNRRSLTFTSPAIAVIDRLLSMSANNSLVHDTTVAEVNREQNEADLALTQLRELLADKEISVYNLRSETKDLKERFSTLETQMKSLETISEARLKNINELTEKLDEKTKLNKRMASVVEEYERTIASLIAETEEDKRRHAEERMQLIQERDEQTTHLASMEVSFSDLHSKYEKSKQMILGFKSNEDIYKKSIKEFEESLAKMQANYESLKQHATSKLNHANDELQKMNKAHEADMLKLNAMIKRKDLHITSLEETLLQKTKANEELTAICDELINKVG